MLEVHIPSVGPEAEDPRQSPEKGHMVFRVEVLCRGRRHIVQRRYSEFHALHKRIKKLYKVPDFPSKRLPNWRTRGLEQRRQGLEAYIQGVLYLNQDVPKELLEFLSLRHFSTDPKASNPGLTAAHSGSPLFSALGEFLPKNSRQVEPPPPPPAPNSPPDSGCPLVALCLLVSGLSQQSSSQLHHRPVISFCMDPYVCIPSPEPLSNMVVNGVLQGLYGFSTSSANAQSEAPCHPAPLPPMP
ncbi:sorting nexin-22 isoform X1 [Neofelis nebulosa]|uniref:sorting nexin-22 isoform X1 n=1 Tax=Neofelis nebulosa TaxID=61452 RepID=UPI00272B0F72|nr:sorting nexin-22 isoform X1 [Neofelis nebulosa]